MNREEIAGYCVLEYLRKKMLSRYGCFHEISCRPRRAGAMSRQNSRLSKPVKKMSDAFSPH